MLSYKERRINCFVFLNEKGEEIKIYDRVEARKLYKKEQKRKKENEQ